MQVTLLVARAAMRKEPDRQDLCLVGEVDLISTDKNYEGKVQGCMGITASRPSSNLRQRRPEKVSKEGRGSLFTASGSDVVGRGSVESLGWLGGR